MRTLIAIYRDFRRMGFGRCMSWELTRRWRIGQRARERRSRG